MAGKRLPDDNRLVYSTDPKLNQRCPKCRELVSACTCPAPAAIPEKISVTLRLEKAKRGGKTVTVAAGLPASSEFLAPLASELKKSMGTGGAYGIQGAAGYIEIQGDRRDALRELLGRKGMRVKG